MDWKNNVWVGVAAAIILIAGVVALIWYFTDTPPPPGVPLKFKCDTCGEVFVIARAELEDAKTYVAYFNKFAEAVPCRECGAETAYQVYLCRKCGDEYYKYEKAQGVAMFLRCPEGHDVPVEDE